MYGGKSSDGSIFDTWLLWRTNRNGWQEVEIQGARPPARFGACLESISQTTGVLFGGIGSDGTVIEDFWIWKIHPRSDGSVFLELTDHTEHLQQTSLSQYIHRFGATVTRTSWGMVIVGGIIPRQIVPYECEIMLLDVGELLKCVENESSWGHEILSAIGLGAKLQGPRPLLVGHVACAIDPGQVLILGGGAVCFSFGTFWTEGSWVLKPAGSTVKNDWTLVPEAAHTPKPVTSPNVPQIAGCSTASELSSIRRIRVDTSEQFQQILADGQPVIIEGSDIGPCTELWTKEYLTDAVGSDRKVRRDRDNPGPIHLRIRE
jgi:tRNA wybutosine-synthesizing protein 4